MSQEQSRRQTKDKIKLNNEGNKKATWEHRWTKRAEQNGQLVTCMMKGQQVEQRFKDAVHFHENGGVLYDLQTGRANTRTEQFPNHNKQQRGIMMQ